MTVRTLSVALLAANSAFADIVSRTLDERADYRVANFGSADALNIFMRIAPVQVVIFDTDLADGVLQLVSAGEIALWTRPIRVAAIRVTRRDMLGGR